MKRFFILSLCTNFVYQCLEKQWKLGYKYVANTSTVSDKQTFHHANSPGYDLFFDLNL